MTMTMSIRSRPMSTSTSIPIHTKILKFYLLQFTTILAILLLQVNLNYNHLLHVQSFSPQSLSESSIFLNQRYASKRCSNNNNNINSNNNNSNGNSNGNNYRRILHILDAKKSKSREKNFLMDEFCTADGQIIDPYKTLKIDSDATRIQIRSSYRTLSKKYHPDAVRFKKILPGSCNNLDDVRDHWERIKLSYEILSDAKMRKKYDRQSALNDPGKALGKAAFSTVTWGVSGLAKGMFSIGKGAVSVAVAAATVKKEGDDKKKVEDALVKIERKRRKERIVQHIDPTAVSTRTSVRSSTGSSAGSNARSSVRASVKPIDDTVKANTRGGDSSARTTNTMTSTSSNFRFDMARSLTRHHYLQQRRTQVTRGSTGNIGTRTGNAVISYSSSPTISLALVANPPNNQQSLTQIGFDLFAFGTSITTLFQEALLSSSTTKAAKTTTTTTSPFSNDDSKNIFDQFQCNMKEAFVNLTSSLPDAMKDFTPWFGETEKSVTTDWFKIPLHENLMNELEKCYYNLAEMF